MATSTTGSTVRGLNTGLRKHFGGAEFISILGNPSGIVSTVDAGNAPSGTVFAYDQTNDKVFRHSSGTRWIELGSVQFT